MEAEVLAGKIVPNYSYKFPPSYPQTGLSLKFGKTNLDTNSWSRYYNFPETGLSFFASNLGNNAIFGNQFNLSPYINFQLNEKPKPYYLHLNLGLAYFTNYYNEKSNTDNVSVSTPFTWAFQAFLYKTLAQKEKLEYRIGLGYSHASNGHTQIPNFGLNSALASFAVKFKNRTTETHPAIHKTRGIKNYFFQVREGIGFHELGATAEPVGGPKKETFTMTISGGITINNHIKIRSGFGYRYYQHFYDYILKNKPQDLRSNPNKNASNIFFFVGNEFLMKHIGLDISAGINIYKPFYPEYNTVYEKNTGIRYFLKRFITSRMGMNLYLNNTNKLPTHNIFAGVHINANFGQADFTEFNIGYVLNLK